jgi:hypothetical protein
MTPHAERFSKVCMGNYKDKKTFPCGRTGGGGGRGRMINQQKSCVLAFFFFGLIKVVKMAFGIEGSLHGWNINYHVATKFRNDG